jgi:hypothetical protein
VLNALLLPLVAGWLIALASGTVLPAAERVRGAFRVAPVIGVSIPRGIGIVGALGVLLCGRSDMPGDHRPACQQSATIKRRN